MSRRKKCPSQVMSLYKCLNRLKWNPRKLANVQKEKYRPAMGVTAIDRHKQCLASAALKPILSLSLFLFLSSRILTGASTVHSNVAVKLSPCHLHFAGTYKHISRQSVGITLSSTSSTLHCLKASCAHHQSTLSFDLARWFYYL